MITQGKWEADSRPCYVTKDGMKYCVIQSDTTARIVAMVEQSGGMDDNGCETVPNTFDEVLANAALIAAAPDLLVACEGLKKQAAIIAEKYNVDASESIWAWLEDAHDAVLKATNK